MAAKRKKRRSKGKRRKKSQPSRLVVARRAVREALRDMKAAQRAYNRAEARHKSAKAKLFAATWNKYRNSKGQPQDAQL